MGYFSDYYLEEFTTDLVKRFLILLNEEKVYENQKYLIIVAQDLVTDKIVKLVDTHGIKYDLCKYRIHMLQVIWYADADTKHHN